MLGSLLTINAQQRGQAIGLVYGAKRFSYAALNERACRLANALTAQGIGYGDRVACLLNNCNQFFDIFFGTAKIGAVFVPINFRLAAREVSYLLNDCKPKLLFVGESVQQTVDELDPAALPPRIVVKDRDMDPGPSPDDAYEAFLRAGAPHEPDIAVPREDQELLVYSSGTTGRPKGAIWAHGTTLASCEAKIIDFGIVPDDVTAVFGPLFHVGPLMDLAMPVLLRGGRLIVGATTGFDPAILMQTVAAERVTLLTVYPTLWRRLLMLDKLDSYDLSSLRMLFTGGEPMSVPLLQQVYARFPNAGFINTYGSTESGPITTFLATQDRERKVGSVGKPAFSAQVRIADEHGRPLPAGSVGEVLVRSPFVCDGYFNPLPGMEFRNGDWWHTGDLAWRDEEGFIWIGGRKKDMIISGAENIYPLEIERTIAELEGVAEVAVVGVPDEQWGESVAAYIVRHPGSQLLAAEVIEHCRANLASYKKPRHVVFVDSLPRTTVNKVSKDTLRKQFSQPVEK
jgi:fatty-acyl-CoA synthase